jgi:hypothetical protein
MWLSNRAGAGVQDGGLVAPGRASAGMPENGPGASAKAVSCVSADCAGHAMRRPDFPDAPVRALRAHVEKWMEKSGR